MVDDLEPVLEKKFNWVTPQGPKKVLKSIFSDTDFFKKIVFFASNKKKSINNDTWNFGGLEIMNLPLTLEKTYFFEK